jgi:hypothetical protein
MSQLQVTGEAKIRDIQGPVVANSGVITALNGAASQYVRGDGTLADFPTSTGGGSSVSYYLNSSVSQGTIGGVAYRQLGKTPIAGAGTDITISANGYVASYITDANDPSLLEVPAGNFNCEFYFSVNNNTGNPFTYAEVYKYDGTTFTLLGTSVGVPEYINQGTTINPYYFAIPVATSVLNVTDRISIRIYVNVDGRTVTLHTENGHLCQVVTTFSKGLISLNNLTRQNQFFATGTSGTDFGISSATATHTFNLPVASATNTGKLSSTDWSTFNNKQNALTNPITGTGASGQIAYFNGTTSITSEAAFNYDASTNRLGVNTSVPNATIGANAGIDSGYSLLLKNDNANYNGIGFGTDSTYGNLISTEKLGTALARNLTLLNQSGFVSLTEAGNLGLGLLTPNTGLDIYNGSNAYLWLHTATSGITGTDGVRLALFSTNGANLRNFDGSFSITAEGDFSIITIGAENFRVNSSDGSIYQSKVANAMLKSVSGVITAAVANTDYQSPITLTTSGSSGAATFSSNTLNIPNYTLSGLGGVPSSRTLTINGTAYDLSADRSWTVGTMGGSGVSGRIAYYDGTNSITSEAGFIYDASTNRLGVNTSVPNATIGGDSALDSGYGLLIKTGASNYNGIGLSIDSTYGNLISTEKLGTASARNLTLLNQSGYVSLRENGNFGINTLNPSVSGTGIDIYGSTSTSLRLHTATSGTTVSDGAGINFSAANNLGITNYENGTIDIVTNGNSGVFVATNGFVGINGATPSVALTVTGAGLFSTSLSVAGLTTGQIVFPTSGGTLAGSSNLFWDNTNGRLSIGASTNANRRLTVYSSSDAEHLALISNVPAITFGSDNSYTYYSGIGMATAANNFVTGAVAGDLTLGAFYANKIILFNSNTNTQRMNLNGDGAVIFSGSVTARGSKSQIVVDGNSVGCGISLTNTIVGANRRNWGIFTEDNVDGDFVIKRSTTSGGAANTAVLSLLNTGAATFSSSVTATSATFSSGLGIATTPLAGNLSISTSTFSNAGTKSYTADNVGGISAYVSSQDPYRGYLDIYSTRSGDASTLGGSIIRFLTSSVSASVNAIERMVINQIGNVGIGTSSPTSAKLQVLTSGAAIAQFGSESANGGWIRFTRSTSTVFGYLGSGIELVIGGGANDIALSAESSNILFATSGGNERMRITSGGTVVIGSTLSAPTGEETGWWIKNGNRAYFSSTSEALSINRYGSTGLMMSFDYAGGGVGSISYNGTIVQYNSTSDYRLKEDLKEYNALNIIANLKTYDFKWKNTDVRDYGMMAHELQQVLPNYVNGEKDAINENGKIKAQGVDYSKIVPILIKSIQELEARIKQLENK